MLTTETIKDWPLPEAALLFARDAHEGQERKYTGGPYIQHPARVASMARKLKLSEEAIAAAYLHDVIEDCSEKFGGPGNTAKKILDLFGARVAFLVDGLTDLQTPKDGNRKVRKERVRASLAESGDAELQTLKILDMADNARSIIRDDPKFAESAFIPESLAMIEALVLADAKARQTLLARIRPEHPEFLGDLDLMI